MSKLIFTALTAVIVTCMVSCAKETEERPSKTSINNTTWQAEVTVTGNVVTQNIFEFSNNGAYFAWRPAGAPSFTGTGRRTEQR
ncbi:hypothetical protein MKQ70_35785 [Chitinophaga sedimenti]|uniref:hypothetical protein n=1 Tax=Chitinophaga sedimenti TaxID=2033606 RepID=UPI002005A673|nr:hypothetical protein [Chitinophaga sedimenti]MCK7559999.1 hypothetical protein [Chitinophaga sedimenti]